MKIDNMKILHVTTGPIKNNKLLSASSHIVAR